MDEVGGVDGADDAGQAVFGGQDGGVAELAALVGDDGGDFPLKWARMRLAMVYNLRVCGELCIVCRRLIDTVIAHKYLF